MELFKKAGKSLKKYWKRSTSWKDIKKGKTSFFTPLSFYYHTRRGINRIRNAFHPKDVVNSNSALFSYSKVGTTGFRRYR